MFPRIYATVSSGKVLTTRAFSFFLTLLGAFRLLGSPVEMYVEVPSLISGNGAVMVIVLQPSPNLPLKGQG